MKVGSIILLVNALCCSGKSPKSRSPHYSGLPQSIPPPCDTVVSRLDLEVRHFELYYLETNSKGVQSGILFKARLDSVHPPLGSYIDNRATIR